MLDFIIIGMWKPILTGCTNKVDWLIDWLIEICRSTLHPVPDCLFCIFLLPLSESCSIEFGFKDLSSPPPTPCTPYSLSNSSKNLIELVQSTSLAIRIGKNNSTFKYQTFCTYICLQLITVINALLQLYLLTSIYKYTVAGSIHNDFVNGLIIQLWVLQGQGYYWHLLLITGKTLTDQKWNGQKGSKCSTILLAAGENVSFFNSDFMIWLRVRDWVRIRLWNF